MSAYFNSSPKPSKHFCDTGKLAPGETYNQEIHNYGKTPKERCSKYYFLYKFGGKSRKTNKKSKRTSRKSRKNRRKSIRSR